MNSKHQNVFLKAICSLAFFAMACTTTPQPGADIQSGLSASGDAATQNSQSASIPKEFRLTMVGKIDRRYDIQMDLEREGDKLKGTYFYIKPGAMSIAAKYIMLAGSIDAGGNIKLTETDFNTETGQERKTGEFNGKLISGNKMEFSGNWTRTRDNRQMPFNLSQVTPELGAALQLVVDKTDDEGKKTNYDLKTRLPRLSGSDTLRAEKFNRAVGKFVSKEIADFKEIASEDASVAAERGLKNSLEIEHSLTSSDKDHVSILFTYFSYTGGAHPNTVTASLNYDLQKEEEIKLGSLFKPGSNYLKVISDYCIGELGKLKIGDADWIRGGAGPEPGNYKSWNITPQGLMITFDAYQVASYAEGPQEVVIPYSVLKPVIKTDSLLNRFINK